MNLPELNRSKAAPAAADNIDAGMKDDSYRNPSNNKTLGERRSGADRRKRSLSAALFRVGPRRRRSSGRRAGDTGGYIDIYDSRTWSITIAVLLLSLADALLTAYQVAGGSASELNPIMNAVLAGWGLSAFFLVKSMMTIVPMTILMVHKEWALGRYAARLCLWSYVLVSLYHLYLIFGLRSFQI